LLNAIQTSRSASRFIRPVMIHSFLYVANTDGIIRFPYRNGELKARAPAETTVAKLSGGAALLRSGGHWKRDILFSPNGKKMYVSIGSRSNDPIIPRKQMARAFRV